LKSELNNNDRERISPPSTALIIALRTWLFCEEKTPEREALESVLSEPAKMPLWIMIEVRR
jgi:hypothetical protein